MRGYRSFYLDQLTNDELAQELIYAAGREAMAYELLAKVRQKSKAFDVIVEQFNDSSKRVQMILAEQNGRDRRK